MNRHGILVILVVYIIAVTFSLPQQTKSRRPAPVFKINTQGLELPSNATSIRENIVDTFSCEGRIYGYYADMDNECQVFHVCLPQERSSARWSFICPAETVFNQATFVCTRTEGSIPCEESEQYYSLNEEIGKIVEVDEERPENSASENGLEPELPTPSTRSFRRGKSRNVTETTPTIDEPVVTVASSRNARISSRNSRPRN